MTTKRARIRALVAKGLSAREIAKETGFGLQHVRTELHRLRHPDKERACNRVYRRRRGIRPRDEVTAERRAAGDARAAEVAPLIKAGMTYTEAAERLGCSRNVVAGLVFRARQGQAAEMRAS